MIQKGSREGAKARKGKAVTKKVTGVTGMVTAGGGRRSATSKQGHSQVQLGNEDSSRRRGDGERKAKVLVKNTLVADKRAVDLAERKAKREEALSPEETELLIRQSPVFWFATCAHIRNKERQDEQPTPNVFQVRMSAAHEWQRRNGLPSRQIDLKPRQVGGTTFSAAILYHASRSWPMRSVVIADVLDHSNNLFAMFCYYATNDDYEWGTSFESTLTEATFSNGSVVEKKTAERPSSTRSSTLQGLGASEVAWWPSTNAKSAAETLLSLGNSLASVPNSVGIKESTPNGAYGAFADDWRAARWPEYDDYWKVYGVENDPGPGSGYIRVFAAWYEFEEYSKGEAETAAAKLVEVGKEERADELRDIEFIRRVLERRGIVDPAEVDRITWRKLAWRRWCVRDADRCRGDWEKFKQEYPSDPVSCFAHSGKPRFNLEGVSRIERMARSRQPMYGVLDEQKDGSISFRKTSPDESWVHVWEEPRIGCHYGMPIDPMTGADQTAGTIDPDHNSVGILRRAYRDANGVQWNTMLAARIAPGNMMDASPLINFGARLARWYGNCLVIPEVNKGLHVMERCKDHELNLYRRTVGIDKLRDEVLEALGWETNEQTRYQIIETLADLIRTQTIDVYCPVVAQQLATFVRNRKGKAEAAPGCKDDDVLMLAIGTQCAESFTRMGEPKRRVARKERGDYW